jgi:succinate dehydrogenase/fumarate reductase flavoprotein subunit
MQTHESADCDLLVIGSGAAGLAAAVTARLEGLTVILVEKAPVLGGTSAISGGWIWVPANPVAARTGVRDSIDAATRYLQVESGDRFDPARVAAYLEHGPRMLELFERKTAVRFDASPTFPDYHPEAPGAACGRSIVATPYDGRALGTHIAALRRPLRETTLFGLNVGSGAELTHFFKATRSLASAAFVVRRILAYAIDRARHGRGMRLANGNALAGRLAQSAYALGADLWLSAPAVRLMRADGRVNGALVRRGDTEVAVQARRGVVLACGGFSHDLERRRALYPHAPGPAGHHSPVPASNTGDGLRLGEAAGGVVERGLSNAAPWVPVSLVPHRDGTTGVFPHVVDRAKPGVIAVTRKGLRFVNEAHAYHDFVQAMIRADAGEKDVVAFVVCDHRAIRRYGLGYVKPFPLPLGPHLASGYLKRGHTLIDLATRAGIEPVALARTVAAFNADARAGRDSAFGKGSTAYNRFQGDQTHAPNACLAPLDQPPYYAVRIGPGDLGTFAGLRTDGDARVLDGEGRPVAGLYAAGNDAASLMGGSYSGAGINLGPAMVFGYLAARHAAAAAAGAAPGSG